MDLLIKFVKMRPLIQLLRSELVAIIKRIGNGNCDISDVDDMNEVITVKSRWAWIAAELTGIVYAVCAYKLLI